YVSCTPLPPPATARRFTLSLHDALPIFHRRGSVAAAQVILDLARFLRAGRPRQDAEIQLLGQRPRVFERQQALGKIPGPRSCIRSEEHTSELQSRGQLVCRLRPEKKKEA